MIMNQSNLEESQHHHPQSPAANPSGLSHQPYTQPKHKYPKSPSQSPATP
ncbi:hypothetical protein Hanom_Chr07g00657041 [Helianthus anomalus]